MNCPKQALGAGVSEEMEGAGNGSQVASAGSAATSLAGVLDLPPSEKSELAMLRY